MAITTCIFDAYGTLFDVAAAARTLSPDDVAFIRRVLAHAQERFRIDMRRVILVGQSDGGFLIWEIACHEPGFAAAYANHAGSYGGPLPERCAGPVKFPSRTVLDGSKLWSEQLGS